MSEVQEKSRQAYAYPDMTALYAKKSTRVLLHRIGVYLNEETLWRTLDSVVTKYYDEIVPDAFKSTLERREAEIRKTQRIPEGVHESEETLEEEAKQTKESGQTEDSKEAEQEVEWSV